MTEADDVKLCFDLEINQYNQLFFLACRLFHNTDALWEEGGDGSFVFKKSHAGRNAYWFAIRAALDLNIYLSVSEVQRLMPVFERVRIDLSVEFETKQ